MGAEKDQWAKEWSRKDWPGTLPPWTLSPVDTPSLEPQVPYMSPEEPRLPLASISSCEVNSATTHFHVAGLSRESKWFTPGHWPLPG